MQSSIFQMGKAEGEAKGKAEALLLVLTSRGMVVTEEQRQRILGEQDQVVLDRWLRVALTVAQTDELWQPPTQRPRRRGS